MQQSERQQGDWVGVQVCVLGGNPPDGPDNTGQQRSLAAVTPLPFSVYRHALMAITAALVVSRTLH